MIEGADIEAAQPAPTPQPPPDLMPDLSAGTGDSGTGNGASGVHTGITVVLASCGLVSIMGGLVLSTGMFGALDFSRWLEWGPILLSMAGFNAARPK